MTDLRSARALWKARMARLNVGEVEAEEIWAICRSIYEADARAVIDASREPALASNETIERERKRVQGRRR